MSECETKWCGRDDGLCQPCRDRYERRVLTAALDARDAELAALREQLAAVTRERDEARESFREACRAAERKAHATDAATTRAEAAESQLTAARKLAEAMRERNDAHRAYVDTNIGAPVWNEVSERHWNACTAFDAALDRFARAMGVR